jgi:Protein of unknown function (DUF2786)
MNTVRGLLAQAEHPNTSAEERDAFTAKAAELLEKYGIDAALLADRGEIRQSPQTMRVDFSNPYTAEKCALLGAVALNSQCTVIRHRAGRRVTNATVFGFPADLERTNVLYTSLLLQATRGVLLAEPPLGSSVVAYRRTWLMGFAVVVNKRLEEAARAEQARAESRRSETGAPGSRSVALVLADRSALVRAAAEEEFPGLKSAPKRQLSGDGWRDGGRAGRGADLGGKRVSSGDRQQIAGS